VAARRARIVVAMSAVASSPPPSTLARGTITRAPSQAVWDALSPAERTALVDALPIGREEAERQREEAERLRAEAERRVEALRAEVEALRRR